MLVRVCGGLVCGLRRASPCVGWRVFYPAPLVMPGASRFDQLLNLTTRLVDTTASRDPCPKTQQLYTECLQKLKDFLLQDSPNAPALPTPHVPIPVVEPTRHRPSTEIGLDLVGYKFTDRALGRCISPVDVHRFRQHHLEHSRLQG